MINPANIFLLRECGPDLMDEAADKAAKATEPMLPVRAEYDTGLFDVYLVYSAHAIYEVVRFGTFYRCSCKDFEFSRSACKHIYLVSPKVCRRCLAEPVAVKGKVCPSCQQDARKEEHLNAPYLPPTALKKPTMIGRIRV